jgi:fumarylacetoacetase
MLPIFYIILIFVNMMLKANNPNLHSWINVPADSDFPIQNIPFGIFKTDVKSPRMGTIIGNTVIDLQILSENGFFNELEISSEVFANKYINDFMALGKAKTSAVRDRIAELFERGNGIIRDDESLKSKLLHQETEVEMLLPVQIGDYTDFYSSREHATNVGTMFRDPNNALLPNWLHIPVGYHGRASSIVVSGTPLRRPKGQIKPNPEEGPIFSASRQLDFELEVAFILGKSNEMGTSISTGAAEDYIFGLALFNDWSARDIQSWEYVPLGPFLGKNFGSTLSPWIVTLEALDMLRVPGPVQEPKVLPYLEYSGNKSFDINLEVGIRTENAVEKTVCQSNFKYMYWTMVQQLAHHTVNGCNMRVGDVCASGTISGPTPDSYGSMLEISWKGTKPVQMPDGTERKFIQDGDTVVLKGWGEKNGVRIGFGSCEGKVLPAI